MTLDQVIEAQIDLMLEERAERNREDLIAKIRAESVDLDLPRHTRADRDFHFAPESL